MGITFWLRWSWRDLRKRAPQVFAIATIIALGAGIYAGLATTSVWRRRSLDISLSKLAAHDVHVSVVSGLTIDRARLLGAITAAAPGTVKRAEARLVAFAPVTAERRATEIPAAGEIVGVDLRAHQIDRWRVTAGSDLTAADSDVALLDEHFAANHHLPSHGTLRVGDMHVRYVGLALSPEFLTLDTTSGEAIQGQATRAILFAPIGLAERINGNPTVAVNDAVLRMQPGVDVERASTALQQSLGKLLPGVALTVTARRDEPASSTLYHEISSEQHLFDVFAFLILAGAGFAAFNLTKRVVEAQRRDIGIAMSLGVPRLRIAIRTMLFAAEITVIGTAAGIGVGWAIANWVLSAVRASEPLPYWQTPFEPALFARAALLGLIVPLAAGALPVWRAVRVQPVEALLPPHLRGGGHRLTRVFRNARLPGTITLQTPLRRIVRAPTRSILTILAIAFIMAPLLAALGATDSASATIDSGEQILTGRTGDRLLVDLVSYQPAGSTLVGAIEHSALVRRAEPGLNTGGYMIRGHEKFGVSISMVNLQSDLSAPASIADLHLQAGGIAISKKAAADLHVGVGDDVTLQHPRRVGTGFRFVDSRLPVRAVTASPYRFVAYMDLRDENLMGLASIVNTIKVLPRAGVPMQQLQQDVGAMPGVASALPASSLSRTMRDLLDVVGNLFVILQVVIAALAFLVAFNASNIGAEERSREHATMFAFGISVRRVAFMSFAESLILGIFGVGLGLGFGAAILRWILGSVFPAAVPDLAVLQHISTPSYLLTVAIGIAAVASAPWLNIRRLRAMKVPSALRYVE